MTGSTFFQPGEGVGFGHTLEFVKLPRNLGTVYGPRQLQQLLSPRVLLATSAALPTAAVAINIAMDYAAWTLTTEGTAAGIAGNATTVERLEFPPIQPQRWIGLRAEATNTASNVTTVQGAIFIPWGGFAGHSTNVFGGTVPICVSNADSALFALIETNVITADAAGVAWQLRMLGAGTGAIPADTHIRLYAMIL